MKKTLWIKVCLLLAPLFVGAEAYAHHTSSKHWVCTVANYHSGQHTYSVYGTERAARRECRDLYYDTRYAKNYWIKKDYYAHNDHHHRHDTGYGTCREQSARGGYKCEIFNRRHYRGNRSAYKVATYYYEASNSQYNVEQACKRKMREHSSTRYRQGNRNWEVSYVNWVPPKTNCHRY